MHKRIRLVAIAFAIVMICGAILIWFNYGSHIIWRIHQPWNLAEGVKAIPVTPMPVAPIPDDFVLCHFGPLSFRAPAAMVEDPKFSGGKILSGVTLHDRNREVFVILPIGDRPRRDALRQELAGCGGFSSITRVRIEACETAATDFRWSMSERELARHRWLLTTGLFLRPLFSETAESHFANETEGLLANFYSDKSFEWYGANDVASGTIIFREKPAIKDLSWVRAVCASLRFSGETIDRPMTDEEVKKIFRIDSADRPTHP